MLERLNQHKSRKTFTQYEASVNELYKMFCEMNNKIINEITVFEKAKELDKHYSTYKIIKGPNEKCETKFCGNKSSIR